MIGTGARNPALVAWLHLMRVYSKMQHHSMDHLGDYDLTLAQFEVLSRLSVSEGMTQQALAERLLVTKGNVCGLIDRMSALGLVERRADPEDRRSNMLFLTDAGRKLASEVIPAHEEFVSEHMEGLSDDEQRELTSLLRKLDRYLDTH